MKRRTIIYKSISILLMLALAIGLISLGNNLEHKMPQVLSGNVQDIIPESTQAMGRQYSDEGENASEAPPPEQETPPNEEAPRLDENTPPPGEEDPPEDENVPSGDTDSSDELPDEDDSEAEEDDGSEPDNEPDEEDKDDEDDGDDDSDDEDDGDGDSDDNGGGDGDSDDDGDGDGDSDEGAEDDSKLRLITDLRNRKVTYNELENDVLKFYAYLINGNGMTLKVKVRNSATSQNGKYLTGDGKNFQTTLCREETNFFTIYIKKGNTTVQEFTYAVQYVAQIADEDNPTIGDNPPTIVTNLEGVDKLNNRNFTLTVKATAYTGESLYSSNIEVMLDGEIVKQPTGGPTYEYQLYFKDPEVGDVVKHTVTVRAWDNEGNSTCKTYNFEYHFVDTGDEIGTAYIVLDATTVGLGILEEPYTYRIKQNVPASYAIMEMLTEYGYEFEYGGTPDVGFYLRRIRRGGLMDYPDIPENLWQKVLQDNLALTGQTYSDSLGEFDYTQGSGWMYSVGGNVYAGKGLSTYFLSNGDTLYLRFTLAYGKDIGGYGATGGNFGVLATYCGKWINDTYVDMHQWGEQNVVKPATCTETGEMCCICAVCNDKKDVTVIPALEHSYVEVSRTEATPESPGVVIYKCEHCNEEKEESIPWVEETEPIEPEGEG